MNDEETIHIFGQEVVGETFKQMAREDVLDWQDWIGVRYCECGARGWHELGGSCERCHNDGVKDQQEWENGGREAKRQKNLEMAEHFKALAAEWRAKGDEPAARNCDRRVEEYLRWVATVS